MTSLDPERLLGEVRWMRALARSAAAKSTKISEPWASAFAKAGPQQRVGEMLVDNLRRKLRTASAQTMPMLSSAAK